jgi:hypothetical protein
MMTCPNRAAKAVAGTAAGRVCNIAAVLRWHGLGGWGEQ